MSREESYLKMLQESSSMQYNISLILEAKAVEAVKSRNWICRHFLADGFSDHEDQVKKSIEIHEQLVAVIDGLTKLENGLARNLKVVLGHEENSGGMGGMGGFGNLFESGDSS